MSDKFKPNDMWDTKRNDWTNIRINYHILARKYTVKSKWAIGNKTKHVSRDWLYELFFPGAIIAWEEVYDDIEKDGNTGNLWSHTNVSRHNRYIRVASNHRKIAHDTYKTCLLNCRTYDMWKTTKNKGTKIRLNNLKSATTRWSSDLLSRWTCNGAGGRGEAFKI
jgi:hypothetical protein